MAVLDWVPVEQISARARAARIVPTLLTLFAAALFALGWATAKAWLALWSAVAWTWAAVCIGWQEAGDGKSIRSSEGGSG